MRRTWKEYGLAAGLVAGVLLAGTGNALGAEPVRQPGGTGSGPVQISPGVPQGTTSHISGPAAGKINPVAGAAAALNRGARENPQGTETASPPKVTQENSDPVPDQEKPAGQGATIGPISTGPGGVRPNKGDIDPHPGQVKPIGFGMGMGPVTTLPGGTRPVPGTTDPHPGSDDGSPNIKCPPGTPINLCNPDEKVLRPYGKPGKGDPRIGGDEDEGEAPPAEKPICWRVLDMPCPSYCRNCDGDKWLPPPKQKEDDGSDGKTPTPRVLP